jgi:type I restriction enzyme M protein
LKNEPDTADEQNIFKHYLKILNQEADTKKAVKYAETELDAKLLDFYPTLTEKQIKQLVVDDKWMTTIEKDIHSEMDRISQHLTQRIKELVERYEIPLREQTKQVLDLEEAVNQHLRKMGFVWN